MARLRVSENKQHLLEAHREMEQHIQAARITTMKVQLYRTMLISYF
ncbi:MAG: hypothetical protein ACYC2U_06495 [Candidatus Amoebophilus sp.]